MPDTPKIYAEFDAVPVSLLYELEDAVRAASSLSSRDVVDVSRRVLEWMVSRGLTRPHAPEIACEPAPIRIAEVTCALDPARHQGIAREFRQVLEGSHVTSIEPQPLAEPLKPASESGGADPPSPEQTSSADDGAAPTASPPEAGAEVQASAPSGEPMEQPAQVTGPLSDPEKDVMALAKIEGREAAEVAAELNRRLQTVAIYMSKLPSTAEEDQADTCGPAEPAPKPVEQTPPGYASEAWRQLEVHLNALGNKGDWTPGRDLILIEGLGRGVDKAVLADQLGVEIGEMMARFRALVPGGKFATAEEQQLLTRVLRFRYEAAA